MPDEIELSDVSAITSNEAIAEVVRAKDAEAAARAEAKQLKKENALLRQQKAEAREQLDSYLQITDDVPLFEIGKRKKTGSKADTLAVPIFLWSDWHCEENVDPGEVRGKNEFNLTIADERIDRLGNKSVEYVKSRESEMDIPEAIVWLGGDFISGYIHEELQQVNELSPPQAILWVKSRIKGLIDYVAREFPKVRVVCNVGNHGRTTRQKMIHGGQRNNFEWLMYHCLAEEFKGNDKVEFFIPEAYFAEFTIFDFKIRTHHGDNLLYSGGIGGPSISINKAILNWDISDQCDFDYFGHLHQFLDHYRWVMNGSLIGYGPYSVAIKAGFQRPIQTVDFIHNAHGRTDTLKVYVD